MSVTDLVNSGAIPTLEMSIRFAGERQRLIAGNIANISTPNFQPQDVSPAAFQRTLREALERRDESGNSDAQLPWEESDGLVRDGRGNLALEPRTNQDDVLFHDRTSRNIERLMQDQAENLLAFRTATELMRSRMQFMREAISERV